MDEKLIIFSEKTNTLLKRIGFTEMICFFISLLLFIVGGKQGNKISFFYSLLILNIFFIILFIFSKRLTLIYLEKDKVFFKYSFLFFSYEKDYLISNITVKYEYEQTSRINKNRLLKFYNKDCLIFKENIFSTWNDFEANHILFFFQNLKNHAKHKVVEL